MESTTLQERRRINDEIERIAIMCMDFASDYDTWSETDRGAALLDIYEGFFHSFTRLVRYTRNLPQLRKSEAEIASASNWLKDKADITNDSKLKIRLEKGTKIFDSYMKLLADQGVVFPPAR
jgi:hypothetical protein